MSWIQCYIDLVRFMLESESVANPGPRGLRPAGYELVCRLGEGGMGEVWAAARLGVEGAIKPCAIKLIRPAFANDARYRQMFVSEGRLAMMLGHANVVSVFDVGVVDDVLFMAMEWVDGVDLGTFRQRVQLAAGGRALSIAESMHIVGALLDALGYAHDFCIAGCEHGVIHRDVAPGNVMVTSRGEVKLMDFGLAALERGRSGQGTGPRFAGTLRYLSREQARGRPEAASDLFAVGAILHELLDGRKFRHDCLDDNALVTAIFERGIPPLSRRVPRAVESLRRGLLEPRAELRIRTARRALRILSQWPGYRNRRLQLESVYRQVFGEPRSGLTQLLSMGVRSELLDRLRQRLDAEPDAPRPTAVSESTSASGPLAREARITRVYRSARTEGGDGDGDGDAILVARTAQRAAAHRIAEAEPASFAEPRADDEVTAPWGSASAPESVASQQPTRSRPTHVPGEPSATGWLSPSCPRLPDAPSVVAIPTVAAAIDSGASASGGRWRDRVTRWLAALVRFVRRGPGRDRGRVSSGETGQVQP